MDYAQAAPSVSQAQRMKKKSQEDGCSLDDMCGIMDEVKKDDIPAFYSRACPRCQAGTG